MSPFTLKSQAFSLGILESWALGEVDQICLLQCGARLTVRTEQIQNVMLNLNCILLAASGKGDGCCVILETIESHLGPSCGPGVLESSDRNH